MISRLSMKSQDTWTGLSVCFFLTEILIRFMAEENKKRFFHNFWNWFDSLIVLISLIPADNTEMALIARLVRVFRVLRMISFIPELRILLVSLVKALPQLGYVMLLLFIIFLYLCRHWQYLVWQCESNALGQYHHITAYPVPGYDI